MAHLIVDDVFGLGDVLGTSLCGDRTEDDVHLLERLALGLGDQQRKGAHTEDIDGREHDEQLPAELGDQRGRDLGDDEIEQPLGGGGEGETVVTSAVGEDVRDVDPGQWTPAEGVSDAVHVDDTGHGLGCGRDVVVGADGGRVGLLQGADDEEEDAHPHGGPEERPLATEELDTEEDEDGSGDDFDDTVDTRGEEGWSGAGVADLNHKGGKKSENFALACSNPVSFFFFFFLTHRLEDTRSVVTDGVLACELLEQEDDKGDDESDPLTRSEESLAEAQSSAGFVFFKDGSLNFGHFSANFRVVDGAAAVVSEVGKSLLGLAGTGKVTWGFLGEDETKGHDAAGNELEPEGNAPHARTGRNVERHAV